MTVDSAQITWDVVVIGAGLGGGIFGRQLAEAGYRVLFVDRGHIGPRDATGAMESDRTDPEERNRAGCWPASVEATVNGVTTSGWGAQGTGPGGTSVFYAAAMERPERHDIEDIADLRHPTGGWPVGHDAFTPWFDKARSLMAVNGTPDPLGEPVSGLATPLPPPEAEIALGAAFDTAGLHPYRAHLGIRQLPGCQQCLGRRCPRACKMDGRSAGVDPALATGNATFWDRTAALALEGEGGAISGLRVLRDGRETVVRARHYVLAAGGFGSPRLLLASRSEDWPQGCANSSGLVGRGLMFHLNERIALWPGRSAKSGDGAAKPFSLRDFYRDGADRLGLFQSLGLPADYGNILMVLRHRYDRSALRRIRIGRQLLRIPARIAALALGDARVYVGILEDMPHDRNRVIYDPARPDTIIYDYVMDEELRARRSRYRRMIKRRLKGIRSLFLHDAPELNIAHPCGTLRFSDDPKKGVLDPDCRAHDVRNLWCVDSSFMPTSTGVNPGMTIVANALRVADRLTAALQAETQAADTAARSSR
ncbi:GMC oxidoreductase [Paracoccus zeaxanthinifaciens]|uniref:GMC oxidoreductase n=1 Tax=Paracoccus zeaxanthinifaciens TaxID=187400 RepID=UPI0003B3B03D|nr:GMC family oxidoreductase [Paracoccus zeaxanthinifaciens]